ncbi:MAG: hypothetical protein WKG32_15815 [Gemmatimonadaceae bacterium]
MIRSVRPFTASFIALAASAIALTALGLAACGGDDGTGPRDPPAAEILARRPFTPTDHNVIGAIVYADAVDYPPATGAEPTDGDALAQLQAYLAIEFPANATSRAAAVSVFNDPVARQRIPSPTLRAALAALHGTFAEPAIDYYLHATTGGGLPLVASVGFGPLPHDVFGRRTSLGASGQFSLTINAEHLGDNPLAFAGLLAHEVLHDDDQLSRAEEATATAMEALFYLRQFAQHPDIARRPTWLSQRLGLVAVALLNTGVGSRLGLLASNGNSRLYPGSKLPNTNFYSMISDVGPASSPGNALLGQYLAGIQEPGKPLCSPTTFTLSLVECLDRSLGAVISPEELVAAARTLELSTEPRLP